MEETAGFSERARNQVTPSSEDIWALHRQRMLAETERFIEWGLRRPEDVVWIPAKPIDRGGFPRKVADWFYDTVFRGDGEERLASWRERLRGVLRRR